MNAGSFFLAEISRMVSSFSPRGMTSDSMSVTNPYLYSPVVRVSSVVLTGSPRRLAFDRARVLLPCIAERQRDEAERAGRLRRRAQVRQRGRVEHLIDALLHPLPDGAGEAAQLERAGAGRVILREALHRRDRA